MIALIKTRRRCLHGQRKQSNLSICNNGCNENRVVFESPLPMFDVSNAGSTMARFSMCSFILRILPKLSRVEDMGRARGELTTALTKVDTDPSRSRVCSLLENVEGPSRYCSRAVDQRNEALPLMMSFAKRPTACCEKHSTYWTDVRVP